MRASYLVETATDGETYMFVCATTDPGVAFREYRKARVNAWGRISTVWVGGRSTLVEGRPRSEMC